MNFNSEYEYYLNLFNNYLNEYKKNNQYFPKVLNDSFYYTLDNGGKRIRPVLFLSFCDILNIDLSKVLNIALSIEFIHTYSLIHDDLPEMDNDDYRRGKLSSHKMFGANNAVLAGDALLNTAFSILFNESKKDKNILNVASYISECSGVSGMVAGQSADILYEKKETLTEEELMFVYENKTSKMLMASCVTPFIYINDTTNIKKIERFAKILGIVFQIKDDILDVEGNFESLGKTIGKDLNENKFTSIKLFGLDNCKQLVNDYTSECIEILKSFENSEFLISLVLYLKDRKK